MRMTAHAIAAIAACLSALAAIGCVRAARWTFRIHETNLLMAIITMLQDKDIRNARNHMFVLDRRDLLQWSDSDKKQADEVAMCFDTVAKLSKRAPRVWRILIDDWGSHAVRQWSIMEPLIRQYREARNLPNLWHDFEALVNQTRERWPATAPAKKT